MIRTYKCSCETTLVNQTVYDSLLAANKAAHAFFLGLKSTDRDSDEDEDEDSESKVTAKHSDSSTRPFDATVEFYLGDIDEPSDLESYTSYYEVKVVEIKPSFEYFRFGDGSTQKAQPRKRQRVEDVVDISD